MVKTVEQSKAQAYFESVIDVTPFKKARMEERKTVQLSRDNELYFGIESAPYGSDLE